MTPHHDGEVVSSPPPNESNTTPVLSHLDEAACVVGHPPGVVVIYDDQCPICRHFCTQLRVPEHAGPLVLRDARKSETLPPLPGDIDLDREMVAILDGEILHGAEALQRLAQLHHGGGLLHRLLWGVLRVGAVARVLYPVFRMVRRMLLSVLRRPRIGAHPAKR